MMLLTLHTERNVSSLASEMLTISSPFPVPPALEPLTPLLFSPHRDPIRLPRSDTPSVDSQPLTPPSPDQPAILHIKCAESSLPRLYQAPTASPWLTQANALELLPTSPSPLPFNAPLHPYSTPPVPRHARRSLCCLPPSYSALSLPWRPQANVMEPFSASSSSRVQSSPPFDILPRPCSAPPMPRRTQRHLSRLPPSYSAPPSPWLTLAHTDESTFPPPPFTSSLSVVPRSRHVSCPSPPHCFLLTENAFLTLGQGRRPLDS